MSDTLLFVFAAACVAAIVIAKNLADRRKRLEEDAILAAVPESENAARAEELVRECVLDLKRQRAGAHGPWLAALIDGPLYLQYDERGRVEVKTLTKPITPGLALSAVRLTIADLSGGRFNLDALYRAASELSNMGQGA